MSGASGAAASIAIHTWVHWRQCFRSAACEWRAWSSRCYTPLSRGVRPRCSPAGRRQRFRIPTSLVADWRDCERRVRSWSASIPADIAVGPVPFARIAREYVREHRRAQVDALTHERLSARLAAAGVRPELVVFPWEGHAWEQVLTAAIRRYMPETPVVGYDNLNFSTPRAVALPVAVEARHPPAARSSSSPTARRSPACCEPATSRSRESRWGARCVTRISRRSGEPPVRRSRCLFSPRVRSIPAQSIELLRKASAAFGSELVARLHPASDAATIRAALPARGSLRDGAVE